MTLPTTRFARTPRPAALMVAALLALGPAACGGNGEMTKPDPSPTANTDKREPSAPVPDNLAETPCGNPDWGELPDQHKIDGDPPADETDETPSTSDETADEQSDDEQTDDN